MYREEILKLNVVLPYTHHVQLVEKIINIVKHLSFAGRQMT
jgi:hypothetical protein